MSDYSMVRDTFRAFPDAFNESATLAQFSERTGRLSNYVGGWADSLYLTDKAHGIGVLARPLAFPAARTFRDLFRLARFAPVETSRIPGHFPIFARPGGDALSTAAPSRHVGGRRAVREFPDGTCVRQRNGAQFFATHVMPRPELLDDWQRVIGPIHGEQAFALSSFDAVERPDGVLVIGRGARSIGDRWLAFLPPGSSIVPMLPHDEQELLQREATADALAWGHIVRGPDGRDYVSSGQTAVAS